MKSQKKSALRLNQGHLVFDLRRSVRHLRIQDSTKGWALPNEVPDLLPQFRRNFRIEECLHPVDQHATGTPGTDWLAEFPREDGSGCSSARRHESETRSARWLPPACEQRSPDRLSPISARHYVIEGSWKFHPHRSRHSQFSSALSNNGPLFPSRI